MKTPKKFFTTIDRFNILKDFVMFIPSILLVKISFSTNNILLFVGLFFVFLSVVIFLIALLKNNKERIQIESLKSYIIDNTENYKKSDYYILNPKNYKELTALGNAPIRIKSKLINLDSNDWDKISIEKEKEYFTIKFLEKNPELNFKRIKKQLSKVYYELGRDSK